MDQDFEALVRERLSWEERHFTFREVLRILPIALSPSNEDARLFALLPAELVLRTSSSLCLWALTSKALMGFEASPGTKVHIVDGPRILFCRPEQPLSQLRLQVALDEKGPAEVADTILRYQPGREDSAILLSSLTNALALGSMWGDPERFEQWIATTLKNRK